MDLISDLFAYWFGTKLADGLSKDHQDDPVYKKNVERLIERNRKFEEERKSK